MAYRAFRRNVQLPESTRMDIRRKGLAIICVCERESECVCVYVVCVCTCMGVGVKGEGDKKYEEIGMRRSWR
jgi:hypothetical protein